MLPSMLSRSSKRNAVAINTSLVIRVDTDDRLQVKNQNKSYSFSNKEENAVMSQ